MARLYLLVGLGNPGLKYKLTRHNAGFLAVDQIAKKYGIHLNKKEFHCVFGKGRISDQEVMLAQPQTFMNLSGEAVISLINYFKIDLDRVLIISDDLDLPLGTIRIKLKGSAGGHKGLTSIINLLGTSQLPRLRIGIGKPIDVPVMDYVLTPFTEDEKPLFYSAILFSAEAAVSYVTEGPEYAMNHFNGTIDKLKTVRQD